MNLNLQIELLNQQFKWYLFRSKNEKYLEYFVAEIFINHFFLQQARISLLKKFKIESRILLIDRKNLIFQSQTESPI